MAARLTTYVVVGIVAATLIAGLIVGAQRDDNDGPVDLIVHNAKVYTADADQTVGAAVAIRGNRILLVGSEREIARLRRPQTTLIDAAGATVLPGFNDAHVRFIEGGLALGGVQLRDVETAAELRRRIRSWAAANPESPWVLGHGWSAQLFADGLPTRQLLDAIAGDRPAQIVSSDGRASWVNSEALRLAGIDRRTPNPRNGTIVRDPRNNEPAGVLRLAAMGLVARVIPAPTDEERAQALRDATAEAHRHGVTSVQDVGDTEAEPALYAEARRAGDLDIRVYSAIPLAATMTEDELLALEEIGKRHPDDPLFKTGAVLLDVNAAVPVPRTEPPAASHAALDTPSPDDLNRTVRLLDAAGWQVVMQASGDRAIRMALNAYQHAERSNPAPTRGRRHRVLLEAADVANMEKFEALDVVASVRPFQSGAASRERAREAGSAGAFRGSSFQDAAANGGRFVFGSGWPHAPLNPILGLHATVAAATREAEPVEVWQREQRTALKKAIEAYTSGAAWASFDEQRKGTIAAGMLADLVVLSADIFDQPPASLADTTVAVTIFDGKIVYRKRDRRMTD